MALGDYSTASRLRDLIKRIATQQIVSLRPEPRNGWVYKIDSVRQLAWILFPKETPESLVQVRIAKNMIPTKTVQSHGMTGCDIVRVYGRPGNYWVIDFVKGEPVGSSGGGGSPFDGNFAGAKGINLGDATDPTDALNLQTGDGRYAGLTATTAALSGKEPSLPGGGTAAKYLRGDKTWQDLNPTAVGAEPSLPGGGTAAKYLRGDKTWQTLDAAAAGAEPALPAHASGDKYLVSLSGALSWADILPSLLTPNVITGAYTIVLSDLMKVIQYNAAGNANITLPADATLAVPVGWFCYCHQIGAGKPTLVAGAGATVNSASSNTTRVQNSILFLYKSAANTWTVGGDMQ